MYDMISEFKRVLIFDSVFILGAIIYLFKYLYFKSKLKKFSYAKEDYFSRSKVKIFYFLTPPKETGKTDYDLLLFKLHLSAKYILCFIFCIIICGIIIFLTGRIG
jgi:hypothetical protein